MQLPKTRHAVCRRRSRTNQGRKLYRRPPKLDPTKRRELKRAEQQTAKPETAVAPDSTRRRPATPLSGKELYAAATSVQLRRHHARTVLCQAGTLPVNKIKDGCVDEKSASETTTSPMSA